MGLFHTNHKHNTSSQRNKTGAQSCMEQRGPHSPDPSVPEAPPRGPAPAEGTGSGSFARRPGGQRQEPVRPALRGLGRCSIRPQPRPRCGGTYNPFRKKKSVLNNNSSARILTLEETFPPTETAAPHRAASGRRTRRAASPVQRPSAGGRGRVGEPHPARPRHCVRLFVYF